MKTVITYEDLYFTFTNHNLPLINYYKYFVKIIYLNINSNNSFPLVSYNKSVQSFLNCDPRGLSQWSSYISEKEKKTEHEIQMNCVSHTITEIIRVITEHKVIQRLKKFEKQYFRHSSVSSFADYMG